jgi:hypothetical protein
MNCHERSHHGSWSVVLVTRTPPSSTRSCNSWLCVYPVPPRRVIAGIRGAVIGRGDRGRRRLRGEGRRRPAWRDRRVTLTMPGLTARRRASRANPIPRGPARNRLRQRRRATLPPMESLLKLDASRVNGGNTRGRGAGLVSCPTAVKHGKAAPVSQRPLYLRTECAAGPSVM